MGTTCQFFFQAEDGIRDRTVTGVQTCALPICLERAPRCLLEFGPAAFEGVVRARSQPDVHLRSEERRVGKECRTRLAQRAQKTNTKRTCSANRRRQRGPCRRRLKSTYTLPLHI